MISCRRPSNRSSRLTLPLGPSNSYFFSTAIHGIRRRSAASASRTREKDFSFPSICCHAASHSCRDTIGGVFISRCPLWCCSSAVLFFSMFLAFSFFVLILSDDAGTKKICRQTEAVQNELWPHGLGT